MAFLLDSKVGFGLACVVGAAAGVMGVVWLQGGDAPAAAPARVASWDGPLGPGQLAAASAPAAGAQSPVSLPASLPASLPGQPPLTDAAGRLVVDNALRRLFDAYLAGDAGAQARPRERELHAWLRSRLQGPALAQAENLAGDYLRYLQAEAALRARERFVPPDPAGMSAAQTEQMLAWQQQRAQLRERVLGTAVAQAWFGPDDARCSLALAEWRRMRAPAGSEETDSNELRARRMHGDVLEQRRNQQAQSCAGQLMERTS
jgi:lipase chaperone LimK